MTIDEEIPVQVDNAAAPTTGIHTDPVDEFKCATCENVIPVQGLSSFTNVVCPSCGTTSSVPARLANFLLLRLLGTGGMGGVYYARDEALGRFVAIKVMLQSLGDDPAFIETFRREAQAVAKLNHPNIAQIYSFGQEKGQPYIVMELVSGDRVDAMMENAERINPALAMRIGLEIAQGLSAADDVGLVHGDIKPENILLDSKGQAKLVDFGLATVAHQAAGEGIWGTPYYIAPEKIRRQKVDARSDIYSLGATLYHMLTGTPPFEGETPLEVVKARLEVPPPDPRSVVPELPEIIATTIKRMLAVDRTERYPNYLSLISDLRKAAQELGGSAAATSPSQSGRKKIRFKTKKGASAPTPAPPSPAVSGIPESKSKKLVFYKDKQNSARLKTTGEAPLENAATTTPEKTIKPEPTPEEIQAKKARAKRRKKRVWLTLLVLLLLAAVAGGSHLIYQHKTRKNAERAEWFALSNARTESTAIHLAISNNVERAIGFASRAEPLQERVQSSVEKITGKRIVIAPPPEEPAEPVEQATPPESVAKSNATSADTDNVTSETADTKMAPSTEEEPETDAVDDAMPPPAEEVDDIIPPPTEPEEPTHPIVAPALQALENLLKLSIINKVAGESLAAASTLRDNVLNSQRSPEAIIGVKELKELQTKTATLAADAKTAFDAADMRAGQVQDIFARYEKQLRLRQEAEQEAIRRREEAEKLERERQEYQQRAAAEIQQAQADGIEIKSMFFEGKQFAEGLNALKQRQGNYSTKEGKEAFKVHVDRYTWLTQMKDVLIASMTESPYAWGWGFGTTARDIEKASVKGIFVKGVPQPYPWTEVNPTQMLKLVDYYLGLRTLRPRDRINLAFGTAIFCDEFGPSGRERTQFYANRALDSGLSRDTFVRLLESGWH